MSSDDDLRQPFLPLHSQSQELEEHHHHDHGDVPDDGSTSSSSSSSPPFLRERYLALVKRAKRNVKRTLALTFFAFTSRSMWSQTALSMFIVLAWQQQHVEYIGYVTAILGVCQVVSSALSRCIIQRYQLFNTKFLVATSFLGICATGASTHTVLMNQKGAPFEARLTWLFISMGLWGTVWGVSESILPVIFTESAMLLERKSFQKCSRLIQSGNIVGNALALGLFYWLGNEWTIANCAIVILVGLFLNLQVFFLLCSLRVLPLDEEEEYDDTESRGSSGDEHRLFAEMEENAVDPSMEISHSSDCDFEESNEEQNEGSDSDDYKGCVAWNCVCSSVLINVSEILSSFAGGMSIRYFPVYFVQSLHLYPLRVQLLYLLVPAGQWLSPLFAKKLAQVTGPVLASIVLQWAFVGFLYSMIVCHGRGVSTEIVCLLYLIHGSLMNSTSSLTNTIVDQSVPDGEGFRWRLAQALQTVLWSAGAGVGGYISGRCGLITNFYTTGAIQLGASIPLLLLLWASSGNDALTSDEGYRECPSVVDGNIDETSLASCSGSGVIFQDCLTDWHDCKERGECETRSPVVSDTTSDTNSMTSADHDDILSHGSSSFVSTG